METSMEASETPDPGAAPAADEGRRTWWGGRRQAKAPRDDGFTFTDDGCRWEVRLAILLMLAAVFMWLWLGPSTSIKLYFAGVPLLLIGVPLQALQGRQGRPGYPWKIGLVFPLLGLAMTWDLRYREAVDTAIAVLPVGPLLLVAGAWILAWWPVNGLRPAVVAGQAPIEGAS